MGIYLGQLPPAELARLKAELAETLIASFCYPRFYDYRTNTLRMRPVDRAKRQEVWMFLSSFDFNSWNRIDIMSPDFQHQVERLLIQFVQRNRSFFGEQGRKRMIDVRMLITNCSTTVTEGLRGHLNKRPPAHPPFGSPRPATSWLNTNVTGRSELSWEQVVNATTLLQQQLQEVRGEAKSALANDARPGTPSPLHGSNSAAIVPPKRSPRHRPIPAGSGRVEIAVPPVRPVALSITAAQAVRTTNPLAAPGSAYPLPPVPIASVAPPVPVEVAAPSMPSVTPTSAFSAPAAPSERHLEQQEEQKVLPEAWSLSSIALEDKEAAVQQLHFPEQAARPAPTSAPARELAKAMPASVVEAPVSQPASTVTLDSDEDIVIFEQLRHQLVVWLRIEVVRLGLDIALQSPAQLIALLEQQEGFDETRLQVISTLLALANQVIATGRATLVEYKQAMMFYLMHTRRAR